MLFYKLVKNSADYFTFTFVRNPWSRCVSAYKWLMEHPRRRTLYNGKVLPKNTTFGDFVKHISIILDAPHKNYNNLKWHLEHQYKQVCDEKNNICVDYIAHIETFESDMAHVLSINNIPFNQKNLNVKINTTTGHYHDYYDEDTKRIVANIYQKDISLFNYSFYRN